MTDMLRFHEDSEVNEECRCTAFGLVLQDVCKLLQAVQLFLV